MKIFVLNGPNLNLLGKREPEIYGMATLDAIMKKLKQHARKLDVQIKCFQSNDEGALVTQIGESIGKFDGIIINPAGYTHTSVALRDAILACEVPCVEVHLTNTYAREDFRKVSLTAGACIGQVVGFGGISYLLALEGLMDYLSQRRKRGKRR